MIAFIICNRDLVPLLEGLCSSNPCRFDFSRKQSWYPLGPKTKQHLLYWQHCILFPREETIRITIGSQISQSDWAGVSKLVWLSFFLSLFCDWRKKERKKHRFHVFFSFGFKGKMKGQKNKRKTRKKLYSERWGRGRRGHGDKGRKLAQSWNQIQTLKDCLCCHIYCAQLGPPWARIVGACRAVSNRESPYPPTKPLRTNLKSISSPKSAVIFKLYYITELSFKPIYHFYRRSGINLTKTSIYSEFHRFTFLDFFQNLQYWSYESWAIVSMLINNCDHLTLDFSGLCLGFHWVMLGVEADQVRKKNLSWKRFHHLLYCVTLRGDRVRRESAISDRGCVSLGLLVMKPRDCNNFPISFGWNKATHTTL